MIPPSSDNVIVLPGEVVKDSDVARASVENKVILGPGLKRIGDNVVICRAGVLRKKDFDSFKGGPAFVWVESPQKRYVPRKGENVIGVVVKKIGDYFKIDICSSESAQLYFLSFENATKKNRPNLNPGDVIYAKLIAAFPNMEPEVVCCDSAGRSEGLGHLNGDGMIFSCSLHLCRNLLHQKCKLLQCLGSVFKKFEVCVGMNGKIWIRSYSVDETLEIADALLSAENVSLEEMNDYCRKVLHKFRSKRDKS